MLHRIPRKSNVVGCAASTHSGAMQPFSSSFTVRFDEADPAGIGFFGHVLRYHHHAYESWVVQHLGIGYKEWFLNSEFGVPLRRSETEHFAPLEVGHTYSITLTVTETRDSGFSLESAITANGEAKPRALVRTVHVFMDAKTRGKMAIPPHIKAKLQAE